MSTQNNGSHVGTDKRVSIIYINFGMLLFNSPLKMLDKDTPL